MGNKRVSDIRSIINFNLGDTGRQLQVTVGIRLDSLEGIPRGEGKNWLECVETIETP